MPLTRSKTKASPDAPITLTVTRTQARLLELILEQWSVVGEPPYGSEARGHMDRVRDALAAHDIRDEWPYPVTEHHDDPAANDSDPGDPFLTPEIADEVATLVCTMLTGRASRERLAWHFQPISLWIEGDDDAGLLMLTMCVGAIEGVIPKRTPTPTWTRVFDDDPADSEEG